MADYVFTAFAKRPASCDEGRNFIITIRANTAREARAAFRRNFNNLIVTGEQRFAVAQEANETASNQSFPAVGQLG